jgi:DNA-binding transcriptional ArsR family regulator
MNQLLSILKAIADETRLDLLHLLVTQDLCGKALAGRLGISEAAVSQHIKVLRQAGLIDAEKRGYWVHYRVREEVIAPIIDDLNHLLRPSAQPFVQCRRIDAAPKSPSKKEVEIMCCGPCCQQPDKLEGQPGQCSAAQIEECHGDQADHPCVGTQTDPKSRKGK